MKSTFAMVIIGNSFTFEGKTYYKAGDNFADCVSGPFMRRKEFAGKTLVNVVI